MHANFVARSGRPEQWGSRNQAVRKERSRLSRCSEAGHSQAGRHLGQEQTEKEACSGHRTTPQAMSGRLQELGPAGWADPVQSRSAIRLACRHLRAMWYLEMAMHQWQGSTPQAATKSQHKSHLSSHFSGDVSQK